MGGVQFLYFYNFCFNILVFSRIKKSECTCIYGMAKKKITFVSCCPTDPNFLVPTLNFFRDF